MRPVPSIGRTLLINERYAVAVGDLQDGETKMFYNGRRAGHNFERLVVRRVGEELVVWQEALGTGSRRPVHITYGNHPEGVLIEEGD